MQSLCLFLQARAAEEDASTTDPLSAACQAELDAYKEDASTNINKNVQLGGFLVCSFFCGALAFREDASTNINKNVQLGGFPAVALLKGRLPLHMACPISHSVL